MGNCLFNVNRRERNGSVPPAAGAAATKQTDQPNQVRLKTTPSTTAAGRKQAKSRTAPSTTYTTTTTTAAGRKQAKSRTAPSTTTTTTTAVGRKQTRDSQARLRVASWNVNGLHAGQEDKLTIICEIIRENKLDFIAFQELLYSKGRSDAAAELTSMCDMLNNEKNKNSRVQWKCAGSDRTGQMFGGSECVGFLWRSRRPGLPELTMSARELIDKQKFTRKPFIGRFKENDLTIAVVNVHLKAQETGAKKKEALRKLQNEIKSLVCLIKNQDACGCRIILLGDFNMDAGNKMFQGLRAAGYTNLIPERKFTNFINTEQYDNIWVRKDQWRYESGDVIRDDRIGQVSDHCPVWASI